MRYMLTFFYSDSSHSSQMFYGADGLADARAKGAGFMQDLEDDEHGAVVIRRMDADGGPVVLDVWGPSLLPSDSSVAG